MQGLFNDLFGSPSAFVDHARTFLGAAVLLVLALIAGWLLGIVARLIVTHTFKHAVEDLSRRLGYKQLEQSLGLHVSLGTLVGSAVQVIVTIVALLLLASIYFPAPVDSLVANSVGYLPTLLIALTVLLVGLFISHVLADLAFTAARTAKRPDAQRISTAVRVGVVILAAAAALLQLGVATVFITIVLVAAFATLTLATGIAAGVGGSDYVRDLLAGRTVRTQLRPGQRVVIGDISGVVIECGSSATLIATDDGKRTLVPNKLITEKSVTLG
jgi:small-conductance mechanosensitive channel